MKLAEALRLRKEYTTNLNQLRTRISSNCIVQEGDTPAEDPNQLVLEYLSMSQRLTAIIVNINHTNGIHKFIFDNSSSSSVSNKGSKKAKKVLITMNEALAEREKLKRNIQALGTTAANGVVLVRYGSRSEIKQISCVLVPEYTKKKDILSKELRMLDLAIQEQNWLALVVEVARGNEDNGEEEEEEEEETLAAVQKT